LLAIGHVIIPSTSAGEGRRRNVWNGIQGHIGGTRMLLISHWYRMMPRIRGIVIIIKTKIQGARDSFQEGLALKMDEGVLRDCNEFVGNPGNLPPDQVNL
jgi:hypothetical protein